MTNAIVAKLKKHLADPVDTECAVVYLLAEVRKLLERHDRQHRQSVVWMYCHWALHVDLGSPQTTLEFLKQVDVWVTNTVAGLVPRGPWRFQQEIYLFRDFIYLDAFRSQLKFVLASFDLPTDLCDEESKWFEFLSAYAGVVQDGTLTVTGDKNSDLGAVKQVTFKKGRSLPSEHHVDFVIQWDIELKDGRTLRTEFNALPTKKMTSHDLTLIPAKIPVPELGN